MPWNEGSFIGWKKLLKDYFLEIVSPEATIIHSLPQETNQMIKFCMIYEFALIGRSEEAINIHVDTMSIHCQLFLYTCRSRKRSFCMRKYCSFQVVFWVIWFSCLCLFPFSGVCLYSQRSEDRYGDDIPK